ncbi:Crp/Fnr family transcriptional regulator [Dyadobacter pollutisoli]|uniref:Crp/Fnr family transcriptional regulator n=1 Tax=Dyadobacter pollutisoli TaxID=2910158 RepID=A0A9E8NBN7_9BACT|nr:Crp/Fnr family transcriptional regulator [Dyadobacter pollutisoli]WAC11427.1 Crp/Fnr family transcriptional regulator [Dyadobacter pollutisoli]
MFSEILRATGMYSDMDVRLFERVVSVREVRRNEVLLQKGEVCRSLALILEGAVFQYKDNLEKERDIIDLHLPNEWVFNYTSLLGQKPSETFIEAFADSRIIELSLETVHYLTGKSLAFLQLNRVLEGAVSRLQFFDQAMTPLEKYQFILKTRPQLVQVFPLKMIASYLKITPETLSRVREKMARGEDIS